MRKTHIIFIILIEAVVLLFAVALFGQNNKLTWETVQLSKKTRFHKGGTATFRFKEPYVRPSCKITAGHAQILVFPYEIRFTGVPGEKVTFECVEGPK